MPEDKYRTTTYETENCIVTVRKPILSKEEEEKRMKALKDQAERYMRAYIENNDETAV